MMVRTRFAPSPTGYLHIGGARTALFSWLYARKHAGKFILRIEDTDRERSTPESVNAILDGMTWLGLEYDEGPFYQTECFERYKEIINKLIADGNAYRCTCSKERIEALRETQMANKEKPRYDGCCRDKNIESSCGEPFVIRFKNPSEGEVVIPDQVRGRVTIKNNELDDLIIARTDGTPTYNLTVVVDDMDMSITHVIRGDDHLNNTPRQMNILNALGAEPPVYAHLPMILGDDGKRLSKRHGAVSVMQYRDDGYLPEAVLNYLVRLGWSHGDDEIFSIEQMINLFDIKDVNHSASSFNTEKLIWLNQQYLMNSDPEYVAKHLRWHMKDQGIDTENGPALVDVVNALKERAKTLKEMAQMSSYFFQDFDAFDVDAAKKHLRPVAKEALEKIKIQFTALSDWRAEHIHQCIEQTAEALELKMGKIGMPLRVAITGTGMSPAIDVTAELIGKSRVLARIDMALAHIEERAAE